MLTVAFILGHGDKVGTIENTGDAGHPEQSLGEWRARRALAVGKFHGAAVEHGAAGNEFQGGGIGGGFGLDEHGLLRRRRFKAGAWLSCSRWRWQTHGQGARTSRLPAKSRGYDRQSISRSFRSPEIMTTGIGNVPTTLDIVVTIGPGPSGPGLAASTS